MLCSEELFKIQLELECIGIDNHRLYRIDGHTCDDIEQYLFVDFLSGKFDLFASTECSRRDAILNDLFSRALPFDAKLLSSVLGKEFKETRAESLYRFAKQLDFSYENVVLVDASFDLFCILADGDWASRAYSVRHNSKAAEIAIETKEQHRRKGFATKVATAWVNHQLEQGKIATYNHRTGNLESRGLVHHLGGNHYADIISFY